ncbi:uncharacterized protein KY384_001556 [Bacidia gigantensis]|uniref:uncharacterized protein n=1 Tax=Bacidia gigantensis TaxID=2732470 RepID=UPI001D03ACF4|nr:uncharacterized protein KY384_001556 [Bacidia gigantensis]KAG8533815.1 hypothetical protein KY384_001556 [Bacidia gigantensis]
MSTTNQPPSEQPATGIPQVVIAQAEAIASSNRTQTDDQSLSQAASGSTQGKNSSSQDDKHVASYDELILKHAKDAKSDHRMSETTQEMPIEERPPPVFSTEYGQVEFDQDGFGTKAKVASDGRLNIHIHQKSRRLSDLLVPALRSQLNLQHTDKPETQQPGRTPSSLTGITDQGVPPLNIVIHVVGSRGDVQPFIALGKVLKETHNHRVRLATHSTFKGFVAESGLEYFDIGGDPAELMAFMVKNPGLMPGMDSLKSGDVGKRRKGMYEILQGCWRSCFEVGDGTGMPVTNDVGGSRSSIDSGIGMESGPLAQPFVADAIIANPPSFAHVHCAEKLGIPLHLMFTMPWSPTQAFPHPLANIQSSNADTSLTNFISYALVEMMTWQGLGDMINRFREKSLGLEPVSLMWAPGMASRLQIPYTYCWSPALIPKPRDWGSHISISGFYFLSLASSFSPEPELQAFLDSGPPPVYLGFGSIVVDDPTAMTKLIFEAVKKTGQRALVSKGWGGFGADELGIPKNVFMLGNVPHDWLFKRVSCVVHHGGAGTTAAGIALGKPTVVVPFFGDQPFWGAMVARAGAGPKPIPSKHLTAENLAAGILEALKPTSLARAQDLGAMIMSEDGTKNGADSFHEKLDLPSLRCSLMPNKAAVWRIKRTQLRLSTFAATTLGNDGLLDFNELKLYRPKEYDTEDGPWDPISGGASALIGTFCSLAMGAADFPVEILRALKIKPTDKDQNSQASQDEDVHSASAVDNSSNATRQTSRSSDCLDSTATLSSMQTTEPDQISTGAEAEAITPISSKNSNCPPRAMAHALHGREPRSNKLHHRRSSGHITLDAAVGAGKGIGRMVSAGVKSPMDFTLGIARGFHNAPKLYGDETVRQSDKVTGIQSGLKAAGKEFGYGMWDGITGLVTQPIDGAKKEGIAGLVKGFGKGIGGVVLKPNAAGWGILGYTFKGIYKEVQKHFGSSVQNYIIAARTAQGYHEWSKSTSEERLEVVSQWQAIQVELDKQRRQGHHGNFQDSSTLYKKWHTHVEGKEKASVGQSEKTVLGTGATPSVSLNQEMNSLSTNPKPLVKGDAKEFEEAIQASVAATSRGNPEEDILVERAIRASVLELQSASQVRGDEDKIQRAIHASVAEAKHGRTDAGKPQAIGDLNDQQLEASLQQSLQSQQISIGNGNESSRNRDHFDDSGIETDDEQQVEAAIRKIDLSSRESSTEDRDFEDTLELSKKAHEHRMDEIARKKKEEELVLEYVKKQSALEEEHRRDIAKLNTM